MDNKIISIYTELNNKISTAPLSELLPLALKLSIELHEDKLTQWIYLEYEGYLNTNKYLTSEVIVPEYRTVVGNYYDSFNRLIPIMDPNLRFINEYRLRNGVSELEELAKNKKLTAIQDLDCLSLIYEYLHIKAFCYAFSNTYIHGILTSIRTKLIEEIHNIETIHKLEPIHINKNLSNWTRDNKLALIGIIVAVIFGIIGIVVSIILHQLK